MSSILDSEIGRIRSVQVGPVAPLGPDATPSGFVKRPVQGPVELGALGLSGDAQADLSVHGGLEKAVYGYAAANYPAWAADFPEHADKLLPGAFGENLTIEGVIEGDLCVGDVHAIGDARLQVCQPRQPCFKFALHFDDARMPTTMVLNGRSGWYYRVLAPGVVAAGDVMRLIERPNPDFPFVRLVALVSGRRPTAAEIERLATISGLAGNLQSKFRALIARP